MTIIGIDEEIDTLSGGWQIDKPSTSPAESPSFTDDDTWGDGDEELKVKSHVTSLRWAQVLSIAEQTLHSQTCKLPSRRSVAA